MRIDRITLRQFRLFEELEIDFHPELTVLVSLNGGGKTAVLDGCATAIRAHLNIEDPDISPSEARIEISESKSQNKPVFAYYGGDRSSELIEQPLPSNFGGFRDWFEVLVFDPALFCAVRDSINLVLKPSGWGDLAWGSHEILVNHPERGSLPLSRLSGGILAVLEVVADLSYRCAVCNSHLGVDACRLSPGVVLIDEVDLRLHPGWQQEIIAGLRTAFPSMQFIVTTHSPQVLSTVDVRSIRVLEDFESGVRVRTPGQQTRGDESGAAMATVMGVDPLPRLRESEWVNDYLALIEQGEGETEAASELRTKILDHFGELHPIVLGCDRIHRFQKFKLRREDAAVKA